MIVTSLIGTSITAASIVVFGSPLLLFGTWAVLALLVSLVLVAVLLL